MKKSILCSFDWLYQSYLSWFHSHARPEAFPKNGEEIVSSFSNSEEIFNNGRVVLNRLVYYVTLPSADSVSGKPEVFGFTELNLMEDDGCGNFLEVTPVEYAVL